MGLHPTVQCPVVCSTFSPFDPCSHLSVHTRKGVDWIWTNDDRVWSLRARRSGSRTATVAEPVILFVKSHALISALVSATADNVSRLQCNILASRLNLRSVLDCSFKRTS